jgi:Cathepsin propeptide inhibitor domain (I29)
MYKYSTRTLGSITDIDNSKIIIEENDDDDNDAFFIQDDTLLTRRVQNETHLSSESDVINNSTSDMVVSISDDKVDKTKFVTMFDPYNPNSDRPSLVDDDDEQSTRTTNTEKFSDKTTRSYVPGVIGFLEMEEEPQRATILQNKIIPNDSRAFSFASSQMQHQHQNRPYEINEVESVEPILTSSGLLLTHRKAISAKARRPIRHSSDVINYPYKDEYPAESKPQHDMISFDDDPLSRQSDINQHNYGLSSSPYMKSSKKYDDEYHRQQSIPQLSHLEFESIPRSSGSWFGSRGSRNVHDPHWTILHQLGRTLSYVRLWVITSAVVLLVGTLVILKHSVRSSRINVNNSFRPSSNKISQSNQNVEIGYFPDPDGDTDEEKIILLPLPDFALDNKHILNSLEYDKSRHFVHIPNRRLSILNHHLEDNNSEKSNIQPYHDNHIRHTRHLRSEFDAWMKHHKKQYKDDHETETRFHVWSLNHRRTQEKNDRHGPCQMTGKAVFGSNHFKDLTQEEFMAQHLTGYTGPRTDLEPKNHQSSGVLGPHIPTARHPDIHRRITEMNAKNWWSKFTTDGNDSDSDAASGNGGSHWWSSYTYSNSDSSISYTSSSSPNCDWYDVSCLLQYIFSTYFYGVGGTMEPAYDADSYPTGMMEYL